MSSYLSCFHVIAKKLFPFFFNSISKMYKQTINNDNKHNKVVGHSKKSTKAVSLEDSVKMRVCYQLAGGLCSKELLKTVSSYHKVTIYKHCRKSISTVKAPPEDKKKLKIGKVHKVDERETED